MDYIYIRAVSELAQYAAPLKRADVLAVDTETTGLDPHAHRIRLIQLAAKGLPVLVLDCFSLMPEAADMLSDILSTPAVKVFQNAKFDLQFLIALGVFPKPIFDTMLAAQILRSSGGPQRANLAALSKHYLGVDIDKGEQKSDWSRELTPSQIEYAARDAEILLRLREAMIPYIQGNNLAKIARIEFECARALAGIEYHGIRLDTEKWKALCLETERERAVALDALRAYSKPSYAQLTLWGGESVAGDNFDSNPYVLDLLRRNGVHVTATGKKHLAPYRNHPLVKAITEYRHAAKALSSFLYPFMGEINPKTGRIHPHYGQIGAWSGRMSCGAPNIQQIPRDAAFRACFSAPSGRRLVIADYSQIELRVAAQISGDKRMTTAYRNGEDLHLLTASLISGKSVESVTRQERQAAKAVNFGLIFGMGAAGLQQYSSLSYGVDMTLEQATEFRQRFFRAYPGIEAWHRRLRENPPREGWTLGGRKFAFSENAGMAGLYNTPVQGTAADIAKKALGMLNNRLSGTGAHIIGFVHDEILLECPQESAREIAQTLKDTMEAASNAILHDVPSEVEAKISMNWAEK